MQLRTKVVRGWVESLDPLDPGNRALPHADKKSPWRVLLMALTGKKKAFAEAVLKGFSNKEAAIKAGYSAATASAAGSRLVKDPRVVAHLAAAKEKSAAAMSAGVDAPKFGLASALQYADPKAFLLAAINDIGIEPKERINAAKALLPLFHGKVADGGKKGGQQSAAAKAAAGKFAPAAPPLKLVGKR